VIGGVGISNGLAWFDDTTALYVDSFSGEVSALTFRDGIPVDRTPVAVFERPEEPDGLVIGPSGEALVAIWRGARVAQLDPATGSTLGEFAVPANFPTSVAVGAGLMLVTTADHVEDDVDPGPLGGHVLCRPYEPPPQQVVR
jgi:sugar lactone lactonase YvrE